MSRLSLIGGCAFVLLVCVLPIAEGAVEQSKVIPLDQIWGFNLPGTRDIAGIRLPETDPQQGVIGRTHDQFRRQREYNIEQMRRALMAKPPTDRALPGFALQRQPDFFTLQRASTFATGMMRYEHQKRPLGGDTFRAGEEMTLVFFSHPASYYVRLRKVERRDNEITVQYEFEPHASPEVTVHFALIPLGKLPAGEYQVHFEQIPLAQSYRDAGFQPVHPEAFEIICRPFTFTMWEPPLEEETPENATLIPLDQIWAYEMRGTRDVGELDAVRKSTGVTKHPIINEILRSMALRRREGEQAGPAFVVTGTSKEALQNAHAILANDIERSNVFAPGTNLNLVFYSLLSSRYVRIVKVEQSPNSIKVKYRFISHPTGEATSHFAIVPLGKLPEGTFQVMIQQLAPVDISSKEAMPLPDPDRIVSQGFSFRVQKEEL